MTVDIGRFALLTDAVLFVGPPDGGTDPGPTDPTGVPYARGVPIFTLSPDFVISTRSSSSSKSLATPLNLESFSFFVLSSHLPSG